MLAQLVDDDQDMRSNFSSSIKIAFIAGIYIQLLGCTGTNCCFTTTHESKDSTHYIVIGFGVITIPKSSTDDEILATKMQSLGLVVSNQPGLKVGLGYSFSSVIAVPIDTNNTVVEASTCKSGSGINLSAISNGIPKKTE